MHDVSCFATLTYSDANLPLDGSLNYTHFQKFMKRLRKANGQKIRFYMCGEYGEKFRRPHYHALLFGYRPDDLLLHSTRQGRNLYTSPSLERIWGLGYVTIGDVSKESAEYCAQYATKKITGPAAEAHYMSLDTATGELHQLTPEFGRMSLKPGIGSTWLDQFSSDIYNYDQVILNGKKLRPPKYYDKRELKTRPDAMEYLQYQRTLKRQDQSENNTPDRLAVRAAVLQARLSRKEKTL